METNKGAYLIAKSVSLPCFGQSYVAVGGPGWLKTLFDSEKMLQTLTLKILMNHRYA
ncbi:unnamed protein product [Eruca vesicaria subsp. sativa]|uniref:Uncharacterized protein n=1 Tax=Eruca vesicaria subsp. sativa TaxID=29727 RepID=A0ABC8KKD0_ERUVS|nr:unnamed protein product [Eruca vesicaria subsp. sativa]